MAAGSTYTPLYTTTLGSAQSSIIISSIPSTYTDLVLIANGATAAGSNINLRVGNGSIDSNTNYSYTFLDGDGTSAVSGRYSSQAQIQPSNNNAYWSSTISGLMIINFQNYANTSTYKTILSRGNNASIGVNACVGLWRSTSAINQIYFAGSSQNLSAGSTFTLYGIQAA